VLEVTVVRHELLLDEVAHSRPDHLLLVSPLDHGPTVAGAPGDGIL
jgi:hypothetical protein